MKQTPIILFFLLIALNSYSQTFGLSDAIIAKTTTGSYALNLNGRVVGMSLNAPFVQMNIGTNNSQNFGLYQNNVQRILMSSTGTAFTGGLTWNSSVLDNVSINTLVLGGTGALGYRPLSTVAFTGNYASLSNTPSLTLQNVSNNGASSTNVLSLGNYAATSGSVLLKANYDAYNSQALITERSSGAIGLSSYMYQDNSATWLSSFNYGAVSRAALFVSNEGLKLLTAPNQNIAALLPLTVQPTSVFSVEISGRINCSSILSKDLVNSGTELRAFEVANKGFSGLSVGTATNAGYFYSYRPNGQRSMYMGNASSTGSNDIVSENGAWIRVLGGKLEVQNNIEGYKGDFSDDLFTSAQFKGGFGAQSLGGVADFNDISNRRSGNGYTLLYGTAANGNGVAGYYHTLNFEFLSKNGTGNFTQIAVPYNGSDLWLRSFYDGIGYTPWNTYIQSTKIQNVGNNDVLHTGNLKTLLLLDTLTESRMLKALSQTYSYSNIQNFNGGINMKASPLSLYTSNISSDGNNLNLKGNVSNTKNVSITSNNELNATLTPFTAYSANDLVNDNQTVSFVSNDVFNLPAATKAVRMVNAQGTTNTGVTINLNVPTMKSKEQVLIFSGVGLAFNANVVFNAPSGWFIYSGGSLAASRTFTSQQTIDAGQGCIYRVLFFTSDNTISIMRIKDN
jgi:hypothetical protein